MWRGMWRGMCTADPDLPPSHRTRSNASHTAGTPGRRSERRSGDQHLFLTLSLRRKDARMMITCQHFLPVSTLFLGLLIFLLPTPTASRSKTCHVLARLLRRSQMGLRVQMNLIVMMITPQEAGILVPTPSTIIAATTIIIQPHQDTVGQLRRRHHGNCGLREQVGGVGSQS